MNISNKVKGILGVSFSNLLALIISLITSFVLPLFISVEQYGYWQLFVMYCGYVGFFAFGFNDGIHLNYAKCDYTESTIIKFGTFLRFITVVSIVETLIMSSVLLLICREKSNENLIFLLVTANIIPTVVMGLFQYLNQATLRFKYYSVANIVDKVLFGVVLLVLLVFRVMNIIPYVIAYTLIRYIAIGYHLITSRAVFFAKPVPFSVIKGEIKNNFTSGFSLMIACIVGGSSIIIGSRILVQRCFGIEAFSQYSFSLHTLVIAAQFISAIATVFYPIMKRCEGGDLHKMYISFDKVTTLLSAAILLSYFPAALMVVYLYPKYISILSYLFIVYPLFIFQCKSNVLIVNIYKVKNKPIELIFVNLIGILLHCLCVILAYLTFKSIYSISLATLLSYCVWYYIFVIKIYKTEKWDIPHFLCGDMLLTIIFVAINIVVYRFVDGNVSRIIFAMCAWGILLVFAYLLNKQKVRSILREFNQLMKD